MRLRIKCETKETTPKGVSRSQCSIYMHGETRDEILAEYERTWNKNQSLRIVDVRELAN